MKQSQWTELRQRVGNLSSLMGFKAYVLNDGPARGVRAFDLKNGSGIEMTVLADRGLDIPFLSFKGVNVGFAAKNGIRAPHFYREEGVRGFLGQFFGGMLTTCGITYSGAPSSDGRALGLHGPYSNLPASEVACETDWSSGEAVLRIRGKVRESCVFEENMVLFREISLETERNVVKIHDVVENQGFEESPVMLIYHVNFGYPLLDEGARVYTNAGKVSPRDEIAARNLKNSALIEAPQAGRPEECFFHTDFPDDAFAMLENERLKMAAILRFDRQATPLLCQWKCMRAGDYALGLEPTVSGVMGREFAKKNGLLRMLQPGETAEFSVEIELTDDLERIQEHRV